MCIVTSAALAERQSVGVSSDDDDVAAAVPSRSEQLYPPYPLSQGMSADARFLVDHLNSYSVSVASKGRGLLTGIGMCVHVQIVDVSLSSGTRLALVANPVYTCYEG